LVTINHLITVNSPYWFFLSRNSVLSLGKVSTVYDRELDHVLPEEAAFNPLNRHGLIAAHAVSVACSRLSSMLLSGSILP
ncbi:hypothetical protein, partial [Shewanella sp. SG44-6]|uniref:hypothetical protein n=1 Tax=Shewanella sp. SG44-6 TaxID=2760959 RepID=UPI001C72188F